MMMMMLLLLLLLFNNHCFFQVAVIDQGRVVELGAHDELMKLGNIYTGLYNK